MGGTPRWVGASHLVSGGSQGTLNQSSHIQEMSLRVWASLTVMVPAQHIDKFR